MAVNKPQGHFVAVEVQAAKKVFRDFLGKKTGYAWTVYPTCFGLSVIVKDNPVQNQKIQEMQSLFDGVGIHYHNEESPAGNVIRFYISKSQKNLEKILRLAKNFESHKAIQSARVKKVA